MIMNERDIFALRQLCTSSRYYPRICAASIHSLSLLTSFTWWQLCGASSRASHPRQERLS